MAKTTQYVVTTETGSEVFGNVTAVAKFLGDKKVTKKAIEAGKYPMVSLEEVSEPTSTPEDTEEDIQYVDQYCQCGAEVPTPKELLEVDDKGEVIKCTSCASNDSDTASDSEPTPEAKPTPKVVDAATQQALTKITERMEAIDGDSEEFDTLCDIEDAINEGTPLTEEQAILLTQVLTYVDGSPVEDDDTLPDDADDLEDPVDEQEYPEVGDFKDEKAMKKFIKGLSDQSLQEWCTLEGVEWKHNDHESINRMRMAMAIKAKHFPNTAPKGGKKSKSKYASYATEDLVQMALDNDVEVPDDKGDIRICRMYTIMALKKAGLLD